MKAMILAAGEGRRMRPQTDTVPKPMLPVAGRPLIERSIHHLHEHGVREIAINLHHLPHAITGYLGIGSRFGVRITYSLERVALGTAGGVKRLERFFGGEPFFVLYGDVYTDLDLSALRSFHERRPAALTMALYQPETPSDCGIAKLGTGGRVLGFVEKPKPGSEASRWANAGIYVVEPHLLRHIPPNHPFDFGADLFPLLLELGIPLYGFTSDALVVDIGTPHGYAQAQALAGSAAMSEAA